MTKPTQKSRLCWQCEGNISANDEVCPYCGVSVRPLGLGDVPYQIGKDASQQVPKAPYTPDSFDEPLPLDNKIELKNLQGQEQLQNEPPKSNFEDPLYDFKIVTITIVSLLTGVVFLLFGTILLLFAHDGVLNLTWDGRYWYIYLLIGIPLLIYGWRQLMSIRD